MSVELPTPIHDFLADFVARRRRLALFKSAALAISAFLAILLLACFIDRLFKLPNSVRAVLLLADLAVAVLILRRPVQEVVRPHANWIEAAGQVESIDSTYAQRLITVTSQLQSQQSYRGSPGMLAALVDEVSTAASRQRGSALLNWRWIKRSLTLAVCFVAIVLSTLVIPWLQMPQLVARFTRPWANIPPVTTTTLAVLPGSTNTPQGRPLRINVTANRVGDSAVQLHVQQAEGWTVSTLEAADAEHFAGDLPPLEKDTKYFVTGGDARSDTYAVHVLTTPGLNDVRARVAFPAYLKWPEKTLSLADGKLEVPIGSEVSLSLAATEPLAEATLTTDFKTVLATTASVDPAVRIAKFTAKKDFTASVTLKSTQGVEQKIAQPLSVKVIPDRPPLVRLLAPTEDLRLASTDLLTTAGQAMDDYGIEQLWLQVKVNDRPPVYRPIAMTGDRKRIELPIECDLSAMNVEVGDVLQFTLLAKDGAGQQRGSDVLRAIVSPRSYDLNAYLRVADLKAAKKIADDLLAQLQTSRNEVGQSAESIAKDGDKTLQSLAAAAQSGQLLSMPLMRAASRSDRMELGDSIAMWADVAEHSRNAAEELQDQRARRIEAGQLNAPLDRSINRVRLAADQLGKVIKQSQAMAVQNDIRSSLELTKRAANAKPGDRQRLELAATKLYDSAKSLAQEAGVNPVQLGGNTPELDSVINDAQFAMSANRPIDFAQISNEWSNALRNVASGNLIATRSTIELVAIEPRLAMASQVETVRPDADFGRAHDWSLAARAGTALATAGASAAAPAEVKVFIGEFPAALQDLQAEHAMRRLKVPPADAGAITAKAAAAREKLRKWAGDGDPSLAKADDLALASAAALQQKQFEQAGALDKARAKTMKPDAQKRLQLAQNKSNEAQRIDLLRQRQQQLAQQTADAIKQLASAQDKAAAQQQMQSLAKQQQSLAKAIELARDEAAEGKGAADQQEQQADPVATIAEARQALDELRQANAAVKQADAAQKAEAAKKVDTSAVEAASAKLEKITPEADEAKAQIDEKVVGGNREMQQEARANNAEAVAKKSDELEAAAKESMKMLDAAEEKLADRDAMAAAESAAKEAGQELAEASQSKQSQQAEQNGKQPNGANQKTPASQGQMSAAEQQESQQQAQQAQGRTLSALERAVDRAAMSGGQARVREIPFVDSIFSLLPILIDTSGTGVSVAGRPSVDSPAAREWGRLRPREESNQTAVSTPTDPPGYEQSIKLYFEALGKEK